MTEKAKLIVIGSGTFIAAFAVGLVAGYASGWMLVMFSVG